MRTTLALSIGIALLVMAAPVFAGPMTGAPSIVFTAGTPESGGGPRVSGGVALAYGVFEEMDYNTGNMYTSVGPIVSTEWAVPVGKSGTQSIAAGGWFASVQDTELDWEANWTELHARFNFNQNWGIEIGKFLGDANNYLGDWRYHFVWQSTSASGKLSGQLGIGSGNEFGDTIKYDKSLSVFANLSYKINPSYAVTLSTWFLSQEGTGQITGNIYQWDTAQLALGVARYF